MPELSELLYDAKHFIRQNSGMANIGPLQIYCSGLAFAPIQSSIRRIFKSSQRWMHVPLQVEDSWSAELQTLEGHSKQVSSVAFSTNGQIIASGSDDGTIRLWDVTTGLENRILVGHSDSVNSIAFSVTDGKIQASGSKDRTVKIWDIKTGSVIRTLEGHSGPVGSKTFSEVGQTMVSENHSSTKRWDTETCLEIRKPSHSVNPEASSTNKPMLVLDFYTITLLDAKTGLKIWEMVDYHNLFDCVAFDPNRQIVAAGSSSRIIKLWDINTEEIRTLQGHSGSVYSVAFSMDGQLMASGSADKMLSSGI